MSGSFFIHFSVVNNKKMLISTPYNMTTASFREFQTLLAQDLTDVIWDQLKKDENLIVFRHSIFVNFWLILDNTKPGVVDNYSVHESTESFAPMFSVIKNFAQRDLKKVCEEFGKLPNTNQPSN